MATDPTTSLRKAIEGLRSQLDKAQSEIASLEEQRHLIASAPPAAVDLHAAIDGWVDAQAHRYRAPLRELLTALATNPLEVDTAMVDGIRPWLAKPLSLATGANQRIDDGLVATGALALVASDLIRAALKAEADTLLVDQPQGLPLAERRARLADLDTEIAAKRAALDALRTEARAAGLTIA